MDTVGRDVSKGGNVQKRQRDGTEGMGLKGGEGMEELHGNPLTNTP